MTDIGIWKLLWTARPWLALPIDLLGVSFQGAPYLDREIWRSRAICVEDRPPSACAINNKTSPIWCQFLSFLSIVVNFTKGCAWHGWWEDSCRSQKRMSRPKRLFGPNFWTSTVVGTTNPASRCQSIKILPFVGRTRTSSSSLLPGIDPAARPTVVGFIRWSWSPRSKDRAPAGRIVNLSLPVSKAIDVE
jgi:hypothetical protein